VKYMYRVNSKAFFNVFSNSSIITQLQVLSE